MRSTERMSVTTGSSLPWWTWVAPFLIAHAATWLSLWFKTGPGASLWYLPTALGIVMVYWWGPRALVGVYLNALVSTPLWDLPWQRAYLYALPETLEVGLSWLLFVKVARGKYWLPDLKNVALFLTLGLLIPTLLANTYLATQFYWLGHFTRENLWFNWQILFSADLATQLVFAVPILVFGTRTVSARGWALVKEHFVQMPFLPDDRSSRLDKAFLGASFLVLLVLVALFPVHDLRILYGFMMMYIAVRYQMNMAILSSSWIGLLAFVLPILLGGRGLDTASVDNYLATNFDILFLCGVTLVTGRAINDRNIEILNQRQAETALQKAEAQYRLLVEQIPPIIYITQPDQHIGVTYISPRIESLGFGQAEWVADPELWFRQLHPDDQPRILAEIEEDKETGAPFRSEYRLIARDGTVRWFLDEATNVFDPRGQLLYRQGFMLDITERKQAEESLGSREQYLAALNDITRTLLLAQDLESTLPPLTFDISKLLHADDCYITRWDDEHELVIPTATTATLDKPYAELFNEGSPEEVSLTLSVLKSRRVLAVENVLNSEYISPALAKRFPLSSALGVPLVVGERRLGAALLTYRTPHRFTDEEIERAEHAGAQIALALWTFQQAMEIQQRLKEGNALAEIGRALSQRERVGTGEVAQLIVDATRELIPAAEKSVIHLLDAEAQTLFAWAVSGYDEDEKERRGVRMRLGEGVAGTVIREGITLNLGDVTTDPHFVRGESLPSFRSMLVAPVQSGEQQIGTISIQSSSVNAFSARDANLLNALGIQAAVAIENTRLFETTQQHLKEVNALYQISRGLAASLDIDQLIREMVALLHQLFEYYHVQIYLLDQQTGNLLVKHGSGYAGAKLAERGHFILAGDGIVGYVAETGEPFFTNNVDEVMFFQRNPLLPETQSEIAVPIKVENQVVGVLDIQNTSQHRFVEGDFQLMIAMADQLAVALQRAGLYRNLQSALQQEQNIRSQLIQSERLALVGRLLASVSHELNNPLQAIQNALFLLKDETNLSNQAKQDLDVILSEAERMAALIERLRSAYRPVRIRDFQPVQLNTLIEDVHMLITTHMRQKEISFEFIPEEGLPPVAGIPDQIRQVALNLFLNAIEVMKPGGRLTVRTRSLLQQKEVLLTVRDTGPGIDAEIMPNIFDPFITSKNTGTGLGLTITHDIIEQHHGRIEADNDPNGGAVFNVWLPIHTGGPA